MDLEWYEIHSLILDTRAKLRKAQSLLDEAELMNDATEGYFKDPCYVKPSKCVVFYVTDFVDRRRPIE